MAAQAGPEVPSDHPNGMALPVLVGLLTLYSAGVTGFDGSWGSSRLAILRWLWHAMRQEG